MDQQEAYAFHREPLSESSLAPLSGIQEGNLNDFGVLNVQIHIIPAENGHFFSNQVCDWQAAGQLPRACHHPDPEP